MGNCHFQNMKQGSLVSMLTGILFPLSANFFATFLRLTQRLLLGGFRAWIK
jgi:hypothetical protein